MLASLRTRPPLLAPPTSSRDPSVMVCIEWYQRLRWMVCPVSIQS
ncbi:MAG: hypothetical protein BJ554DRAFT_5889 [Olpidium bornovanus]|uniref:Uncharacterized protein n=1 Tax=Olpidium bornovanus TaxID=278681 RepID=A0A8H8DML3_9FUNG|nr:MAG: hypothetical protein BJ554DRAFT_5889 [Olpidium bornovanus]